MDLKKEHQQGQDYEKGSWDTGLKKVSKRSKKGLKLVASGSVTKTMTTMVHQIIFIKYDTMKFENINKKNFTATSLRLFDRYGPM
jgi:hypothetical protein